MFCIIDLVSIAPTSSATPTDGIMHHSMETAKAVNKTEYVHSSTLEITWEKHELSRGAPGGDSKEPLAVGTGAGEILVCTQ